MSSQETVQLNHEGAPLRGQLLTPDDFRDARAAVLVFHDAMGLSAFTEERARQLADRGYIALAADMYGDGAHSEIPEEVGKYFSVFHEDPNLLRARVVAWYEKLKSLPNVDTSRIAAIGYCFGGQCVLELARSGSDVRAIVGYHGLLTTHAPAARDSLKTHVAVYTGSKDPYVPPEQVEALKGEMTDAGASLQLTVFSDAYHAFTNPSPPRGVEDGMAYDEVCDRVSWAGTLALLETTLA